MTRSIAIALLLACAAFARDAVAESVLLIATPRLQHPLYSRTVVVARSFGDGQHFGFIVNRPLNVKLGRLFPQHEPSRKVTKPVFFGGPAYAAGIFALVQSEQAPGGGCIEMAPGLFAVMHHKTVDRVIEANPEEARYFAGIVVWQPGELARELAAGAWYTLPVDADLALHDPEGLWEELAGRGARRSRLHWTRLPAGRPLNLLPPPAAFTAEHG